MDHVYLAVPGIPVARGLHTALAVQVMNPNLHLILMVVGGLGLGLVQHLVAVFVELLLPVKPGHRLQEQDLLALRVGYIVLF